MAVSTQGQGRAISVPGAPEKLPEATLPSLPMVPQLPGNCRRAGEAWRVGGWGCHYLAGQTAESEHPPSARYPPQPHLVSSTLAISLHRWGN